MSLPIKNGGFVHSDVCKPEGPMFFLLSCPFPWQHLDGSLHAVRDFFAPSLLWGTMAMSIIPHCISDPQRATTVIQGNWVSIKRDLEPR